MDVELHEMFYCVCFLPAVVGKLSTVKMQIYILTFMKRTLASNMKLTCNIGRAVSILINIEL